MRIPAIAVIVLMIALVPTADVQVLTVETADRVNVAATSVATQPDDATDLRDLVGFDASVDVATQGAGVVPLLWMLWFGLYLLTCVVCSTTSGFSSIRQCYMPACNRK